MNPRNVCIVGLAAVASGLAGCAAQYRNPSACIAEMHSRLDEASKGPLSVTHRAVSYRGRRVVIEGQLEPVAGAAAAASAPAGASGPAAVHTETSATALAATGTETAPVASTSAMAGATSTPTSTSASAAPSTASPTSAATPPAAASIPAQPHPTTPLGALFAHVSHPHKTTPAVAECTFDESGLTSFRWLAPAALAKTTPAPTIQPH